MALFSRGGSPAPPSRTEPGSEELGSPAFHKLVEMLDRTPERKYEILDLAGASGNHVEFFSRYRCRFHVGALEERLAEWQSDPDSDQPTDANDLLPLDEGIRFDLILCWNLLNYVNRDLLPSLSTHLHSHCRRGAWLHTFIHTSTQMPEQPGNFQLLGSERMRWHHPGTALTKSPQYPQRALEKRMHGFRSWQSRLLRNGLQEYLFRAE